MRQMGRGFCLSSPSGLGPADGAAVAQGSTSGLIRGTVTDPQGGHPSRSHSGREVRALIGGQRSPSRTARATTGFRL